MLTLNVLFVYLCSTRLLWFLQFGGLGFVVCVCTVCGLITFVGYWFLLFVWDCIFAGYMIVRCLFLWLAFGFGMVCYLFGFDYGMFWLCA